MTIADNTAEIPTADDLRKKLAALAGEIDALTRPGLGKAAAQLRDRPLAVALAALGIGLIGGYLLKR